MIKKAVAVLFTMAAITVITLFVTGAVNMPLTKNDLKTAVEEITEIETVYINDGVFSEYITVVGKTSEKNINDLEAAIAEVGEKKLNGFSEEGGMIFITDKKISEVLKENFGYAYDQGNNVKGFYIMAEGKRPQIWISSDTANIKEVVLHEFGHYTDENNGWISGTDEFLRIFKSEKESFSENIDNRGYYTGSEVEYFAECYSLYMNGPELLKESCPETYSFIENLIS